MNYKSVKKQFKKDEVYKIRLTSGSEYHIDSDDVTFNDSEETIIFTDVEKVRIDVDKIESFRVAQTIDLFCANNG